MQESQTVTTDGPSWKWKAGRRQYDVEDTSTQRNRKRRHSRKDAVDWGYRRRIVARWNDVQETEFLTLGQFARQYGLQAATIERWEKALAKRKS